MSLAQDANVHLARTSIIGFACNQGFVFSLFYMGSNQAFDAGSFLFERAELFGVLAFMVAAFVLLRAASEPARDALLSRPLLWSYAALLVVGSFVSLLVGSSVSAALVFECALLGIPAGFMLAAWGRALGAFAISRSVPEVLIGSALGAAVCFACAVLPVDGAVYILKLLPLGSAYALRVVLGAAGLRAEDVARHATRGGARKHLAGGGNVEGDARRSDAAAEGSAVESSADGMLPVSRVRKSIAADSQTDQLTGRIMAGTAVFGLATGFMETYGSDPGMATTPTIPVTLFMFVLFCLAALQLFVAADVDRGKEGKAVAGGEAGKEGKAKRTFASKKGDGVPASAKALPRENASANATVAAKDASSVAEQGPLDGAYRLAVLLMMAGFLFVPVLVDFGIPGEAIVLAGYLGLSAVLVSLFLVMGRIAEGDAALSFARGFTALFAGEMAGIALGNVLDFVGGRGETPYVVVAFAGLAALYSYLFLFTERDFRSLSVAVRATGLFEEACQVLVEESGLSRREAEILPLALKGRTGERIASEFFISKSTVDTHLRRIYQKCGVHSRQELIDLGERTQRRLSR